MTTMRTLHSLTTVAALSPLLACTPAAQDPAPQDPARAARLATARATGLGLDVAIYPVRVLDRPNRDVGDALGLLLEQRGLTHAAPSDSVFAAASGADWPTTVASFAAHVQAKKGASYGLYAEFLGTAKTGAQAVRVLLVDARGGVVIDDERTGKDADFARALAKHAEPMTCCVFASKRLSDQLQWPAHSGKGDPQGRFAKLWAEKSTLPPQAERDAMDARRDAMRKAHASARFVVLPARVADAVDAESASRLATALNTGLHLQSSAAAQAPKIAIAPTSNEQKALWEFARAVRAHVRANPVDADYVVMADFRVDAEDGERGAVHLVVCDRSGEWVAVDMQNSHHADYQKVLPKDVAGCEQVARVRIERLLR